MDLAEKIRYAQQLEESAKTFRHRRNQRLNLGLALDRAAEAYFECGKNYWNKGSSLRQSARRILDDDDN